MEKGIKDFILDILKSHNILTLATLREDGYPQANTVTYASDDLTIYFATDAKSQKVKNLKNSNNKVSLTVDREYRDWNKIKGLSMAATAEVLTGPGDIQKAMGCLVEKFPPLKEMPEPEEPMAVVKLTPRIISVLNYEMGFGHNELIEV
ncbi:MAG: pyridoxamine 5'-phosphate oxidase family protein [Thermodesulfobacteriota bacterium]|nr:pyridoxamine 5'-phosphate oxidase family protein [Thermodesulfobacteriota bacterium]